MITNNKEEILSKVDGIVEDVKAQVRRDKRGEAGWRSGWGEGGWQRSVMGGGGEVVW